LCCYVLFGLFLCTPSAAACPNEAARISTPASLPDCRAYELVSPPDTNGRRLGALSTFNLPANPQVVPSELASPSGDSVVFISYHSALPEVREATGVVDVYEAQRKPGAWQTIRRLSPSGSLMGDVLPGGVSADHQYAFAVSNDAYSPLEIESHSTSYLGKPSGAFELLGVGSLGTEPFAQGRYLGDGGQHVIFSTGHGFDQSVWCSAYAKCKVRRLEPMAPPEGTGAIYDRSADGPPHVVSLLPGDQPPNAGEDAFYRGNSRNASSVAFEIEGSLYLRIHNGEGAQEETLKIAEGEPVYAGLSDEGNYLFYVVGGDKGTIHRVDTTTDEDVVINPTVAGEVVNISADGTHIYFIAEQEIGNEGTAGAPNLFVWAGGMTRYIATVAPTDLEQTSNSEYIASSLGFPALTNWTEWVTNRPKQNAEQGPGAESSRSTPTGDILVFESRAKLTGYENAGHTEIYRYDAEAKSESVVCVSCNNAASQATADARLQFLNEVPVSIIVNNVNNDGSRIFFETPEALVGEDVDGVSDIYEWSVNEGQVTRGLISSGLSTRYPFPEGALQGRPVENALLSVTPDGANVVFQTQNALTPDAPLGGALQIYDARIDGGFPMMPAAQRCAEEGCHINTGPLAPALTDGRQATDGTRRRAHRKHCRRRVRHKRKHHRCTRRKTKARKAAAASSQAKAGDGWATLAPLAGTDAGSSGSTSASAPDAVASAKSATGEYSIETARAEESTSSAGEHPDITTDIELTHTINVAGEPEAADRTEELSVSVPPGLLGNVTAVPTCSSGELLALNCPVDSQVGVARVLVTWNAKTEIVEPLYNLVPPHPGQEVARLGFTALFFPVFIDVKVRTAGDYGVTATAYGPSGLVSVVHAETTLWGNPAAPGHDGLRMNAQEALECDGTPCSGERESGIPPAQRKAFMTNPSACQQMSIGFAARSYQLPGQVFEKNLLMPSISDCTGLPFAPSFTADPTSHVAGARTGLRTVLRLPQHLGEEELATATMREAKVMLPAGLQIAPGAANWIGTCSNQQVGLHEEVDAGCPDASKLGTATITSPDLPEPIEGAIYQRNPQSGHQFGLWLTADALGMHIKIPGELEPDKQTGRLTAVFRDLPQVPVEEIALNVWGGPRAPLENPDRCGTFAADFSFSPHSEDPAVTGHSDMQITGGCDKPFDPRLEAGVVNPVSKKFSPFIFDLERDDSDQALQGFELKLPDGELAMIKGVPLCSDAAATGGDCPAVSSIGHVIAAAGAGPEPLWVPQPGRPEPKVYLAGPYLSSPFSVVTEVPAQAGPFDLGTLVVRSGLGLESDSNRAVVKADPLPRFFEGVALTYRRFHVVVDRPHFMLNPTDCSKLQVNSSVTSTQGVVAHPSSMFRVGGCGRLGFAPRLSLFLKGGTKRAEYPALTAVIRTRRGDANIAMTSVALPHSEFLAQEHIATICTRKKFVVDSCPKGSIYGTAKAWTPLLSKPLQGPVYLRSSNHPLPDLVVALGGELDVNLVGRIDSTNGGIRTTFDQVPDAPVTKFILKMRGGTKSLLVNSTDLCAHTHRATVRMRAQNRRALKSRPLLESGGCQGAKR
jgi:hypothetical protein